MAWSTASVKRERRRQRSGTITTEGRGIPLVNQLRVQPANPTRYSDGNNGDMRIGFRCSDGTSVMHQETLNEMRDRLAQERREDYQNHLFDTADRLRRMREAAAAQGTLDMPDHW